MGLYNYDSIEGEKLILKEFGELCDSPNKEIGETIKSALTSPASLAALASLGAFDPMKIHPDLRVEYLEALEKQQGWFQSLRNRALLSIVGNRTIPGTKPSMLESNSVDSLLDNRTAVEDPEREEISAALHISGITVQNQIETARSLESDFPIFKDSLEKGECTYSQIRTMVDELSVLFTFDKHYDQGMLNDLQKAVLISCKTKTPGQIRQRIQSILAKAEPEYFSKIEVDAKAERKVIYTPLVDGMAELYALLPAKEAQALYNAINHHAKRKRIKLQREFFELNCIKVIDSNFEKFIKRSVYRYLGFENKVKKTKVNNSQSTRLKTGLSGAGANAGTNAGVNAGVSEIPVSAQSVNPASAIEDEAKIAFLDNFGKDAIEIMDEISEVGNFEVDEEWGELFEATIPTIDQLRADSMGDMAFTYLNANADTPIDHKKSMNVNVTMTMQTLLGLNNDPAQLEGFGTITAEAAREIAKDATWRRIITDESGEKILDYGRKTYNPPQVLVDLIQARDQRCRFPSCRQPAYLSDIDHVVPWNEGGETKPDNLGILCRRHHKLKTHYRWNLKQLPDGGCQWTSPTGKKYVIEPRPILTGN